MLGPSFWDAAPFKYVTSTQLRNQAAHVFGGSEVEVEGLQPSSAIET